MLANRMPKCPRTESPSKNTPEVCTICSREATGDDVFECGWCESHQHSACLKISPDQSSALSNVVGNIVYFCSTCLAKVPMALLYYDEQVCVDQRLETVETKLSEVQSLLKSTNPVSTTSGVENAIQTLLTQHQKLSSSCEQLTSDLCSQNSTLQNQFNSLTKKFEIGSSSNATSPNLAVNVIEEYADRDRRKCNLIVFNVPESTDTGWGIDTESFVTICKSALNYDVKPTKVLRLGKKGAKPRPLLVALESEDIKRHILMNAHHLRFSEQYKGIFISTDMTKSEREQHKILRAELQQRKSRGETNLTIRNGQIIVRRPLPPPPLGTGTSGMQTDQRT